MRLVLRRRIEGQIEFGLIYGFIVLTVLIAGRFLPVLAWAPSCAFHSLTGAPCPTCGGTRSVVLLSHGNIASALYMNPFVAVAALFAILYFFYSLITFVVDLPRINASLSGIEKDRVRLAAILLMLLNWLYLIISR